MSKGALLFGIDLARGADHGCEATFRQRQDGVLELVSFRRIERKPPLGRVVDLRPPELEEKR